MDNILQDFSSAKIAQALVANEIAFWTQLFGQFPQAKFYNDSGILWFETGIRHDVFNRVIKTRIEPEALHTTLHRVIGSFQERRLPFLWHMGPSSHPANLGSLLQ